MERSDRRSRTRRATVFLAATILVSAFISVAALTVACQAIVGLDRFTKIECTKNCDAGPDVIDTVEAGPDSGPGLEPSEASVAFRWAHWPMPNPDGGEVDANVAFYGQNTFNVVDGSVDGSSVVDLVIDGVTGLTWEKRYSGELGYAEANAYCAALASATGKAFRLPTRIELVSILDYTQNGPSIDPAFGATAEAPFWTQSVALGQTPGVWIVNFNKNWSVDVRPSTAIAHARCVQ
jgi:hypothetical protein